MKNLEETAARLREAAGAMSGAVYEIGSCAVGLESNSPQLLKRLGRYFRYFERVEREPDFLVTAVESEPPDFGVSFTDWPREGGKRGRKDEYCDVPGGRILRKVRTSMQFLIGAKFRMAVGPCAVNDNQIVNFVNAQYMNRLLARNWILCHAAAVVRQSSGLAMAGFSGGGKSTLALHLMSAGCDYASNDRLLIRREADGVLMSGVPKLPRINPGTALNNANLAGVIPRERRAAIERLPAADLWDLEEKYDVFVDECFPGARFRLEAPLTGFLILNWRRDSTAPTRFERVDLDSRRDLLPAIMKSAGPFFTPAEAAPDPGRPLLDADSYVRCLSGVPVYEISGRVDFAAAVRGALAVLDREPD